ncbi:MAG: hypothetical protein JSS44_09420 [Proteobacteria bacterium]|nr:hypothetical protein [Pseudomonadota bacterium]
MNRQRLILTIAGTALLAGCATTSDTRYAAAPAGVYADGYYVPAQDGNGDYYYDDSPAAPMYGSFSVGFGFGSAGWGPGWYGPGFGPWGWSGWGWGPGWGPWGFVGWGPRWYPPGYWHHRHHGLTNHGTLVATREQTLRAPLARPAQAQVPPSMIHNLPRQPRWERAPTPPREPSFREPRHDFHHERP